jgi:hypothetical protein
MVTENQEILFQTHEEIPLKKFMSLDNHSRKKCAVRFWGYVFISFLFSVMGVAGVILYFMHGNLGYFMGFAICAMFVNYFWQSPAVQAKRYYKDGLKQSGEEAWIRILSFRDEKIEFEDNKITLIFPYNRFIFIREFEDCFHLWEESSYVIIEKSMFTIGDPQEFRGFIESKCFGDRPHPTEKQHNRQLLKKLMPLFVICIVTFAICFFLMFRIFFPSEGSDLDYNSLEAQIALYEDDDRTAFVYALDLSDGAVIFYAETPDLIGAALFREIDGGYDWADAHIYSIETIINWSYEAGELFESRDHLLTFDEVDWAVVYGVAKELNEYESEKYVTVDFSIETEEFVLYYRIINK